MKATKFAFPVMIFVSFLLLAAGAPIFGQAGCLTEEEAKRAISRLDEAPAASLNKPLQRELLDMRQSYLDLQQKISADPEANQDLVPQLNELGRKNLLRLCEIIRQHGWVRKEQITEDNYAANDRDGYAAALFLIRANREVEIQRELFPVIAAAVEKGLVGRHELAWLIDSIRTGAGQTQIFGTQTTVRNGIIYLYPLQSEERVDEWRKMYNLAPLEEHIRYLQAEFQAIVLKTPRPAAAPKQVKTKPTPEAPPATANANRLLDLETDEVIKVESRLINLNVRVSASDPASADLDLQKSDFVVLEDGKPQEIEFFSAAETPFDLILLLDLSGSTSRKLDLIRQSTQRFIEAARPVDRIAIVTFSFEARIISDLTQNRAALLKSLKKIDEDGGSGIWGAIEFAFEKIIKPQSQGRRSAIVLMTDGVDSSLTSRFMTDGYPTFMKVLETVRNNDATIIPIYLDTEAESDWMPKPVRTKAFRTARQTLEMLAEESGGQVYRADRVEDLNGVYEKVINDFSRVYSLGYQSTSEGGEGGWRKITVQIPNHPSVAARTRPGYYAN